MVVQSSSSSNAARNRCAESIDRAHSLLPLDRERVVVGALPELRQALRLGDQVSRKRSIGDQCLTQQVPPGSTVRLGVTLPLAQRSARPVEHRVVGGTHGDRLLALLEVLSRPLEPLPGAGVELL
jgi:hypothetical protein